MKSYYIIVLLLLERFLGTLASTELWPATATPPPLATVEAFDTGFAVSPQGKLATRWGQIKQGR